MLAGRLSFELHILFGWCDTAVKTSAQIFYKDLSEVTWPDIARNIRVKQC